MFTASAGVIASPWSGDSRQSKTTSPSGRPTANPCDSIRMFTSHRHFVRLQVPLRRGRRASVPGYGRGARWLPVANGGDEDARRVLPGNPPLVLAPATVTGLAAVFDDGVPVAGGFRLGVGGDLKAKGLAVLELRPAVEADAGDREDGELDGQDLAFLPDGKSAGAFRTAVTLLWGKTRA